MEGLPMSNRTRTSREYSDTVDVNVNTHVDGERLFYTTSVELSGYFGLGVAKRNPADPVDFNLGRQLSLSRALRDLSDNIEKELRP